jgi:PAN domain
MFVMMATCPAASAAEIILLQGKGDSYAVITIRGEIEKFDDERFEKIALKAPYGVVILESPGGLILPALNIGRTIQLRGYDTAVASGTICSSACGLVWLAGKRRGYFPNAQIGFHAAHTRINGQANENGMGNALVGAYLNDLQLGREAILWLTAAPPDDMLWLRPEDARELGIEIAIIDNDYQNADVETKMPADSAAPRFKIAKDRDIYGFDLSGPLKSSSANSCQSSCARTSNCKAFTFNEAKLTCYLKSNGGDVFWYKNVTSGYLSDIESNLSFRRIVIVNSTALEGLTYEDLRGVELEQCARRCHENVRCTGFEYQRKPMQVCSLKEGKLRKRKKPRQTAGIKTVE